MLNSKYNFDTDSIAFDVEEMVRAIEKDYGRAIARIPIFIEIGILEYEFTAIFTDFKLLEGRIKARPKFLPEGMQIQVEIDGEYH